MSKKEGFTLIELLVVIAIIALLMAILMPALGRVRTHAKAVACQMNLKQWGSFFAMFVADNDGYMMDGWQPEGGPCTLEKDHWMGACRRYYGEDNDEIRCCPTATNPDYRPNTGSVAGGTFATWGPLKSFPPKWNVRDGDYGSYGISDWVCDPDTDKVGGTCQAPMATWMGYDNNVYWRTPDVKDSGRIPCFLDSVYLNSWPHHLTVPQDYEDEVWLNYDSQTGGFNVNRHSGAVNGLFLDWSVRRIGLKSLWYQKWHRFYDFSKVLKLDSPKWPDWMKNFQ